MSEAIWKKKDARVLISLVDHLGDTLLYTPALADLKTAHPRWQIYALANRLTGPVLENNPHLQEIISCEDSSCRYRKCTGNFYNDLRRRNFDLIICFSASPRDYLESFRIGGGFRIGTVYENMFISRLVSSFTLNKKILCSDDPGRFTKNPDTSILSHEVEQNRKISAFLEAPATDTGLVLNIEDEYRKKADAIMENLDSGQGAGQYIGLQLSDRWFWNKDSSDSLARLIHRLSRQFPDFHILCFSYGGIQEIARKTRHEYLLLNKENALLPEMTRSSESALDTAMAESLAGRKVSFLHDLPLKTYASVLRRCRFLVTCHSGATHISAAVGTSSVVVFHKPYYEYFSYRERPWQVKHITFPKEITASDYESLTSEGKEYQENRLIDRILGESEKLIKMLENPG